MSPGSPTFDHAHRRLMPGVELYIHAVRGGRFGVVVDAGIAAMRDEVLELARRVAPVRLVLVTHAHADHIGCLGALVEATGVLVVAAGAVPWIEDLDEHYRAFCRTAVLADPPGQREEILGLMDGGAEVALVIGDGTRVRLDDGLELVTVALPGHKLEEVGFLEPASGTLLTGDVLLALAAPFFHGFETARGFRTSLARLDGMVRSGTVQRVLSSHHHPLDADAALDRIAATRAFLDEVEAATLEAATGRDFEALWRAVSERLGKVADFRGYAMLEVQVAELVEAGRLRRDGDRIVRT